ncbi:hypothetical protein TWF718_005798 [Orbilia javanica]|uniref:Malonyl-CoA:ACP transacylase (MAT) domain-containing protein n=1 Tax=Orbilia javanica TaxID=47235 RepID=A0AAN8RJP8_9PEZI
MPKEFVPCPESGLREASLNNFGAGGANGHAIIEAADYHLPSRENPAFKSQDHDFLLTLTAKEEKGIQASARQVAQYLRTAGSSENMPDLAYTLNEKWSKMPWRTTVSARSVEELCQKLEDPTLQATQKSAKVPRLGFVFTGQGVQWYAMGRELIAAYPVFYGALGRASRLLVSLGARWDLFEELHRDEKSSLVHKPYLGFPLSIIIQISLVELLRSWGIIPTASTGHSSGEIPAAYAAGILSFEDAVTIAYVRGEITSKYLEASASEKEGLGAMTALRVGKESAKAYISSVKAGTAVISCVNSPASVTIGGDVTGLEEIEARANSEGVFYIRLDVPVAYHSPFMKPLASEYYSRLRDACFRSEVDALASGVIFASPVSGKRVVDFRELRRPEHWINSMIQCVEFEDAVLSMLLDEPSEREAASPFSVDSIIEIAPYGALQRPLRQILSHPTLKGNEITVGTCLKKNENAVLTMQQLAGELFCQGFPIQLHPINFPHADDQVTPRVVTGLPQYQ